MDNEWIEELYNIFETGFDNYVRPSDYKERALRVLNGARKPLRNQIEGEKGYFHEEN